MSKKALNRRIDITTASFLVIRLKCEDSDLAEEDEDDDDDDEETGDGDANYTDQGNNNNHYNNKTILKAPQWKQQMSTAEVMSVNL